MKKYLLDTNAYFALLKYVSSDDNNEIIDDILKGECYISRITRIEIISVIGKYARGSGGGVEVCDRIHEESGQICGKRFTVPKRKRWNQAKLRDWLKLEKEVSSGKNCLLNLKVLEMNSEVLAEAEKFIQYALTYNFKSMDAVVLGTAKVNSSDGEMMIVVTADKGLKAGMNQINYPHISIT